MVSDKNPILLDIQMWNEVSISLIQLRVYNGKVMLRWIKGYCQKKTLQNLLFSSNIGKNGDNLDERTQKKPANEISHW